MLITADLSYYRPFSVVKQALGYPANEKWIALSTDAYNQMYDDEMFSLHQDCKKEGIGLIRVSAGKRVTLLEHPVSNVVPAGHEDFLTCYARAASIRDEIARSHQRNPAPNSP